MFIKILMIKQYMTIGRDRLIPACSSRFLDIVFKRIGYFIVYDHADISFIHPHAKSRSSNHNPDFPSHKRILVFGFFLSFHFPMIRPCLIAVLLEPLCQPVCFCRPRNINYRGTFFPIYQISHRIIFFLFTVFLRNIISKIAS